MELVKRIIINNVCHCDFDLEFFFAKFTHHCTSVSLTLPTISPTDGIEMKSKHSGRKREIGLFASMFLEK